jgi:hypothetical protein
VAQLYPQALGSLFVASYLSQGYCAAIRPRLHPGLPHLLQLSYLQHLSTDSVNSTSIVACEFVAVGIFVSLPLPSSGSTRYSIKLHPGHRVYRESIFPSAGCNSLLKINALMCHFSNKRLFDYSLELLAENCEHLCNIGCRFKRDRISMLSSAMFLF